MAGKFKVWITITDMNEQIFTSLEHLNGISTFRVNIFIRWMYSVCELK